MDPNRFMQIIGWALACLVVVMCCRCLTFVVDSLIIWWMNR